MVENRLYVVYVDIMCFFLLDKLILLFLNYFGVLERIVVVKGFCLRYLRRFLLVQSFVYLDFQGGSRNVGL